ncbi:TonB family protein [Pantoea agglomerans]|uniref:TonB family protein n=1 Tax=Enterobacter agglomerans TaxID=549 RepID=UPI0027923995|nr:TonB family protein [Pantoea agglomerans]MDQ0551151.1 TonB family protein [Pantoea agglomerans]
MSSANVLPLMFKYNDNVYQQKDIVMYGFMMILAVLVLNACTTYSPVKVEQLKPLRQDRPVYPYYAAKNRIEGMVKFNFDVDAEGRVSQMRIIESTPDHLFDDAVITAVSKWRFEKGKPARNLPMTVKLKVQK